MQEPDVVGERIRIRRMELGFSQEDLAAKMQLRGHASMYGSRVSQIELGQRYVRPAELISFSRALNVRVSWLLGVSDEPWD